MVNFGFAFLMVSMAAAPRTSAVRSVSLIADANLDRPARYGLEKVVSALQYKGITVNEGAADLVILAGLGHGQRGAAKALMETRTAAPAGPEALTVRVGASYRGKPAIILAGSDTNGLMYAALDLADRIGWARRGEDPFEYARSVSERPFLRERGVAIFAMNRAYFESHLLDERYWVRYFDMLAADRFNRLVLTFGYEDGGYMAPFYPYFFGVEGFPEVHVVGLTPEQQVRNFRALKVLIRLAAERGIRVKPGIWEHIYRGRLRGQDGGNLWASDGTKPVKGLVWGLDAKNLVSYTVAALRKFYRLFPEIDETQFRMHGESGLFQDEIEGFWHEVFGFYRKERRNVRLELRVKELPKSVIRDAQAQGLKIQLDTKIWMEQMGLPFHPTHINKQNQMDSRHSYADLLEYPQTYHMNWTLWNGGTARLLLWGDADYARRMVESARLYDGQGMTVTEMEATKMLGELHDTPPRDFLNARYRYYDYESERYWAFYRLFGRISYNPSTAPDVWKQEFARRFGPAAAPHVENALKLASRVLPRIVAAGMSYQMFPTTAGWVEMMHLGGLPQYALQEEGSDAQQFISFRDEAASIFEGTDTAMRRPEETSRWFATTSAAILAEVAAAERSLSGKVAGNEFRSTMTDAKILAALARYHSWRQLGGVNYCLYKQAGDLGAFDEAISDERNAIQAWRELVKAAGDFYIDDMSFGSSTRSFPHHWKDELPRLASEFARLLAERKSATGRAGVATFRVRPSDNDPQPPKMIFVEGRQVAMPGRDFAVKAKVTAPTGVKSIRLRYRHVNQKEDYQSVDMTFNPRSGTYDGAIPDAFIDPRWDLMYFVEIVDHKGVGRNYPDLEVETPYKVVSVAR